MEVALILIALMWVLPVGSFHAQRPEFNRLQSRSKLLGATTYVPITIPSPSDRYITRISL